MAYYQAAVGNFLNFFGVFCLFTAHTIFLTKEWPYSAEKIIKVSFIKSISWIFSFIVGCSLQVLLWSTLSWVGFGSSFLLHVLLHGKKPLPT